VAYERLHHGLVVVPCWGGPAIAWLRLYRDSDAAPESVGVLTEVPGNPGHSIANGHEWFTKYLEDEFQVDLSSISLVHVWPADFTDPPTWSGVDASSGYVRADTSRSDVEATVGQPLSNLPAHNELYAAVLGLGGGNWDDEYRPRFEACVLNELPVPHNPARCEHHDRYLQIRASITPGLDRTEADQRAGRLFLESLTLGDCSSCRFHDGNWRSVANASVEILERLGPCDPEHYIEAAKAKRRGLGKKERRWLVSLFNDPIFIGGGGFTNGQHRACALRMSGAPRAAIHVEDELLGRVCTDLWRYTTGG
jgi:hypothetical protein